MKELKEKWEMNQEEAEKSATKTKKTSVKSINGYENEQSEPQNVTLLLQNTWSRYCC